MLIECKNYSHAVPVDYAEEFFAKVQQVAAANVKAVIASTASFQWEPGNSRDLRESGYFDTSTDGISNGN